MSEHSFAGFVDPSLYLVILSADEIGWQPRPPTIELEDAAKVVADLAGQSTHVSNDGVLDYRFAASLHERKHFLDMHFSTVLWSRVVAWLHCTSNLFSILSNLRGKKVNLPLYTCFGRLRHDLPLDSEERENMRRACDRIFKINTDRLVHYSFECSATILQFAVLADWYREAEDSDPQTYAWQYRERYFRIPLTEFNGDADRAFCFHNFCAWFCSTRRQVDVVRERFRGNLQTEDAVRFLLRDEGFHEIKQDELRLDSGYLQHHAELYRTISSPLVMDLGVVLSRLVSARKRVLDDLDLLVSICSSLKGFIEWVDTASPSVPFLVDFGASLKASQEISENYSASRWIMPQDRFFYYRDPIGEPLFDQDEIDRIIWQQHLCGFLIDPAFQLQFQSSFILENLLEIDFVRDV